jgi:hypothetical protein
MKKIKSNRIMIQIVTCLVIFLLVISNTYAGQTKPPVKMTLHPSRITESASNYRLLPKAERQIDEDAMPLYEKATKSMSKDLKLSQIRRDWLKLPFEEFPQKDAEELIQEYLENLKLVARAVRYKECNWPDWKPGDDPIDTSGYRNLAFIIRLWARLEISRGQFNGAGVAMQTGFGMTKHLGQAPTSNQGFIGLAVGGLMCEEIEQFVQQKDSPNLYWALENLPRSFIDLEKAFANEIANIKENDEIKRRELEEQLESAYDKMRNRLSNHLSALQVIEAIRNYTAVHEGRLPEKLSDISEVEVPKDLVSGEAFEYRRTDAGAILKSAILEGSNEKVSTQYEIV